jgi:general secretion pathway protein K
MNLFKPYRQSGAAIITALLIVTLTTVVVSGLFWRQHVTTRSIENRLSLSQTRWVERAAIDWARVVIRSARRAATIDLTQSWAVPVAETRLDETVTAGARIDSPGTSAASSVLSGQIVDAQGLFNLNNLIKKDGTVEPTELAAYEALLLTLNQPVGLAATLSAYLMNSVARDVDGRKVAALNLPLKRVADLLSVSGYDAAVLKGIEPYVVVLPLGIVGFDARPTAVNLNTAPAEVITARIPGMVISQARAMVSLRERAAFSDVAQFKTRANLSSALTFTDTKWRVDSDFFLVRGVVRYDQVETRTDTLLVAGRNQPKVDVLWQDRY